MVQDLPLRNITLVRTTSGRRDRRQERLQTELLVERQLAVIPEKTQDSKGAV